MWVLLRCLYLVVIAGEFIPYASYVWRRPSLCDKNVGKSHLDRECRVGRYLESYRVVENERVKTYGSRCATRWFG